MKHKAAIFDLDGVLADTAKYHFQAWRRLASSLGINFTEHDNERLKGVSRMRCLDIILELGGVTMDRKAKEILAERKNTWYREYLETLDESCLLEGAHAYVSALKRMGILTAVGSASRNARAILEKAGVIGLFDAVVDGNMVHNPKPDPEVFLLAASMLRAEPAGCVVFEDAVEGIRAAKAAGMTAVGIGSEVVLSDACLVFPGLGRADFRLFQ